jgi:preprotein translocase subunit SecG
MFGAAKSADFIEKATWGLAATLLVLCLVTSLVVKSNRPSTTPPQGSNLEYKMPQQNEPAETFYF